MASAPRMRMLNRRPPPLVDPRGGDIETDASSPERRSLLAIAGNLLAEVSLPKMAVALGMLIVVPAVLVGLAPIVATIWARKLSTTPGTSGVELSSSSPRSSRWPGMEAGRCSASSNGASGH